VQALIPWRIKALLPVVVFMGAAYWTEHWALAFSAQLALLTAVIISENGWQAHAFRVFAAVLPLSVKFDLGALEMMLPGEWFIAVLALVVFREFITNQRWNIIGKRWLPALWILTFVVPLAFSEMLKVSVKFTLLNLIFVWVFYYGAQLFERREVHLWLRNFFISFLLAVLWGAYQFYQYDFNPITIVGIFKPFFYSSTYVGAVAALFAGYFLGRSKVQKRFLALFVLALVVVIFTESRAALLSIVIMLAAWALLHIPRMGRLFAPIILLILALSLGGADRIREAFQYNKVESHDPNSNVFEETLSVTNVQTDVSNMERLNRWVSALKMFQERPHVGFGPGTYQFQYIPFQESGLMNRLSVRNPDDIPQGSGGSAHNELLLQLSENGWPSVLVFVMILVLWMRRGIWTIGAENWQSAPYFLGIVTYLFHMNVNNFLNQPGFAFLFWTFGALLMAPRNE